LHQCHNDTKAGIMPLVTIQGADITKDLRQSDRAMAIRSGVVREFSRHGWSFIPELSLKNGRRADLIALDEKGLIHIFEIKSSLQDLRADQKWHEYKAFCDVFYFATLQDVPADAFPETEGLVICDVYGCEITRDAKVEKIAPATRKAVTLLFAKTAAQRLTRFTLHESKFGDGSKIESEL